MPCNRDFVTLRRKAPRVVIPLRQVRLIHLGVFASYRYSKVIHRRRGEHLIYSPQPPVNNFGGAQKMCCEKPSLLLNQQVEHAGAGRRILRPNVATFSQRLSLRHPAPCCKGTLRTFRLQVQTLTETNLYKPFHPAGPRAQSQTINP